MKTYQTTKGQSYIVTSIEKCDIKGYLEDDTEYLLLTVPANSQGIFVAISNKTVLSDDNSLIIPFVDASIGLGAGGGMSVDTTYNATSTNAQSGIAVAQALASISGSTDRNECEYALIYLKDTMGSNTQPKVTESYYITQWESCISNAVMYGGFCFPLGDYGILVKKPANGAWDDNEFGLNVFSYLLQIGDTGTAAQVIYFNL